MDSSTRVRHAFYVNYFLGCFICFTLFTSLNIYVHPPAYHSGARWMFLGRLFVCQHDNFQTIKRRTMKLGCTKISPEFEFRGHRPNAWLPTPQNVAAAESHTQKINKRTWQAWPQNHIHQSISNAVVSSASSMPVGKSAHAV